MGNKKLNTKPKQSLRKFYRLKGIRLSKTSKRKNVVPNQDNGVGSDPNINIEGLSIPRVNNGAFKKKDTSESAYSLQRQADEPQSIVVEVPRELTAEELEEIKRAEEREKLKRKLNLLNVDMVGTLESRALRIRPEPIITPVKEKKPKIKRSSSNSKEYPSDTLDEKGESPYFEGNLVIDESQFEDEAAGGPSVETDQPWQPYSGSPSKTNTKRGRPKKITMPRKSKTKEEVLEKRRLDRRRRYEMIKSDPALYALEKEKERQRYLKRKEQKKILSINDMTPKDKKKQRKKWRDNFNKFYHRKISGKRGVETSYENTSRCSSDNEDSLMVDEDLCYAEDSNFKDNCINENSLALVDNVTRYEEDHEPSHNFIQDEEKPSTSHVKDNSSVENRNPLENDDNNKSLAVDRYTVFYAEDHNLLENCDNHDPLTADKDTTCYEEDQKPSNNFIQDKEKPSTSHVKDILSVENRNPLDSCDNNESLTVDRDTICYADDVNPLDNSDDKESLTLDDDNVSDTEDRNLLDNCDDDDSVTVDNDTTCYEEGQNPSNNLVQDEEELSTSHVEEVPSTVKIDCAELEKEITMPRKRKTREEMREKRRLDRRRRYEMIKSDPVLYALEKERERQRYLKRKRQKKILSINDMSPRDRRKQRQKWRENYSKFYYRKIRTKRVAEMINKIVPNCSSDNENPVMVYGDTTHCEEDHSPPYLENSQPSTRGVTINNNTPSCSSDNEDLLMVDAETTHYEEDQNLIYKNIEDPQPSTFQGIPSTIAELETEITMPRKRRTRKEMLEKRKLARRRRYKIIKSDPALYALEKEKERQRYLKRKRQRKILSIKDMSPRERRKQRQKWRENYSKLYYRKMSAKRGIKINNNTQSCISNNEDSLMVDADTTHYEEEQNPPYLEGSQPSTEPKVPRATTKQEKDKKKRGRPVGSKTQPDPQRSKKPVKPKTSVEFERQRVRLIVVRVYDYLEREYEFLKTSICSNCNLRPLANILKRTAEATGFTENIIDKILKEEKEQKERLQREAELLAEKRKAQRIRSRLQKAAARERIANANKSVNTSVASDNIVVSEVSSDGNSVLPVVETLKVEVFDVEYNDMGPFMGEAFSEPEVMLPQGTITMVPNVAVRTISEPQQWPPEVKVEPLDMDVAESTAVIPTLHPNQPVNADPLAPIPTGDPLKPDPTETAGDPTGTAANPTKKYTPRDPVEADLQETNSAVQILRTLLLRD